jgi:hypothetical protein
MPRSKQAEPFGKASRTEEIFGAVEMLVIKRKKTMFTRLDVKTCLKLTSDQWNNSYTSRFQGMIENPTDGAPQVAHKFQGVFKRVGPGMYTLTKYGKSLLENPQ